MNETSDTRTKILDLAQDLIQRHGVNGMSYQDLSTAIGIKKASIHYHFPGKDDLVKAIVDRYLDEFTRAVSAILNSRVSGKTKLKRFCGLFAETLEDDKQEKNCLCGMLAAEMSSLSDQGLDSVQKFFQGSVGYIRGIIKEGVEDGSLDQPRDVSAAAEMVLATLEGGLLLSRCDGGPKRFSAIVNQLLAALTTT